MIENQSQPSFRENKPLDYLWFQEFEKIGSFQAYEYLDGNKEFREAQKLNFLANKENNPELDYPLISQEAIKEKKKQLIDLKDRITKEENNPIVRQLYIWKINEKIAELILLSATRRGNMKTFQKSSEFVYGKPDPIFFAYTVNEVNNKINKYLNSDREDVALEAKKLQEMLGNIAVKPNRTKPNAQIVDYAKVQTLNDLSFLLETDQNDKESFSAEEIRIIFENALAKIKADGWTVIIDNSSKTGISVDQEKKQIKVPATREINLKKMYALIAHEIGTHVLRRENGARSKLQLLSLGLDRYEKGEEGLAKMREQVLDDKGFGEFAGLEPYFSIGLAYGLDGIKRDFKDVYKILEQYFYIIKLAQGKTSPDIAKKDAEIAAWNRSVRTFRGTDCKTPGVCSTKDMVYREGNIGVWNAIGNNPEELLRLNIGKYDPSNPRHIWVLTELGITPNELDSLEKMA